MEDKNLQQPSWRIDIYSIKDKDVNGGFLTDISTIYTSELSIKKQRNYPDEISFTIDLKQLQIRAESLGLDPRSVIEPYRHNIKVFRNNIFIAQAIVTKVSVNLNNQGKNTVEVSCVDVLSIFEKRLIHQDYAGGSWAELAAQVVMDAQHEPNRIYNYAWEGDGTGTDNAWFRGWKYTPPTSLLATFPEWRPNGTYQMYDKITYAGKFWEANKTHIADDNFTESNWEPLAVVDSENPDNLIPIYGVWREDDEEEGPTGTALGGWAGTSSCHMTAKTYTYTSPESGSITLAGSKIATSLVAPFEQSLGKLYCKVMCRKVSNGPAKRPWGNLQRIYFSNWLDDVWYDARYVGVPTNIYELEAYSSLDGTGENLFKNSTIADVSYGTYPYSAYTDNANYATDGDTTTCPTLRLTNADYPMQDNIGTWYTIADRGEPAEVKSIKIYHGDHYAKQDVTVKVNSGKNLFNGEFTEESPFNKPDSVSYLETSPYTAHLVAGETYTFSCKTDIQWGTGSGQARAYITYVSTLTDIALPPGQSATFTATETGDAWVTFETGLWSSGNFWNIQIEKGNQVSNYQPYMGDKVVFEDDIDPGESYTLIQDPYYTNTGDDCTFRFFVEGYGGIGYAESPTFTVSDINDWTKCEYTFPQQSFDIYRFGIKIEGGEALFDSPVCYKEQLEDDDWDLGLRVGIFPTRAEQTEAGWRFDRFTSKFEWKNAKETLYDLSNMDSDNFWYMVDENYNVNFYINAGDEDIRLSLSYPMNITSMTVDTNAKDIVNYVKGDGSSEVKQDPLVSGVENNNSAPFTWIGYNAEAMQDYWALASAQSYDSERTIESLRGDIASTIDTYSNILDVPSIKVQNGTISPEDVGLGDIVSVSALDNPYVQRINGLYKVIATEIHVDTNDVENITITLIVPSANQLNALSFPQIIKNLMLRVQQG